MWGEDAAKRLLSKDREMFEDASVLESIFDDSKRIMADLGCGPGFYAKKLKEFASVLYCIDSSKAMLAVARKNLNGKNVRFIEADSSDIPLSDSSVDVLFMANSFHDMDKKPTSKEVMRILKPDGMIVIIDWEKSGDGKEERGPPAYLRMSKEDYLKFFPGFGIKKEFTPGRDHFGIVLVR